MPSAKREREDFGDDDAGRGLRMLRTSFEGVADAAGTSVVADDPQFASIQLGVVGDRSSSRAAQQSAPLR